MIQMNHLVITCCFFLLCCNMGCSSHQKEVVLSDDFFCNLLERGRVDIRLDYILTLESFKNGKKPYRLDKRPDNIEPLKVYVWSTEIEPLFDKLDTKIIEDFNPNYSREKSIISILKKTICDDFEIREQKILDKEIFKYNNLDRGLLLQTSKFYFKQKDNKAIFFVRLTRSSLSSTESAIILKKENEKWIYEKSIGISMS